jgi:hypothetical protein
MHFCAIRHTFRGTVLKINFIIGRMKKRLAESSLVRVERSCGCGRVIEVHLGAVTLRFDHGSLASLHRTLGEALGALTREREDAALALDVNPRGPIGQA